MRRRVIGLILISLGIGIALTLLIPAEFWAIIVAVSSAILGILLLRC